MYVSCDFMVSYDNDLGMASYGSDLLMVCYDGDFVMVCCSYDFVMDSHMQGLQMVSYNFF